MINELTLLNYGSLLPWYFDAVNKDQSVLIHRNYSKSEFRAPPIELILFFSPRGIKNSFSDFDPGLWRATDTISFFLFSPFLDVFTSQTSGTNVKHRRRHSLLVLSSQICLLGTAS